MSKEKKDFFDKRAFFHEGMREFQDLDYMQTILELVVFIKIFQYLWKMTLQSFVLISQKLSMISKHYLLIIEFLNKEM